MIRIMNMSIRGMAGAAAVALAGLVAFGGCREAAAPPAAPVVSVEARLAGELTRLEGAKDSIDRTRLVEALHGALDQSAELIAKTRGATSEIERLYRLQDAHLRIETLGWMASHADAGKSLEALEPLWKSEEAAIRAAANCNDPEILYRGLCQAAANRAEKLYEASLPYGKVSDPQSGLYYLAEGVANARFASFVATLAPREGRTTEKRPDPAALERAWNEVNDETIAFFESDPTARTAIPVSVKLKEARELLDRGFTDGALVRLLEARLELSRRKAGDEAVPMPDSVAPSGEGSVAALIDALGADEDQTRAAIVRRDVAPLYLSLFGEVAETTASVASTTVTLVRWPYT